jgi:hypothetical protein
MSIWSVVCPSIFVTQPGSSPLASACVAKVCRVLKSHMIRLADEVCSTEPRTQRSRNFRPPAPHELGRRIYRPRRSTRTPLRKKSTVAERVPLDTARLAETIPAPLPASHRKSF